MLVIPFIPGDIIKAIIAITLAKQLIPRLSKYLNINNIHYSLLC